VCDQVVTADHDFVTGIGVRVSLPESQSNLDEIADGHSMPCLGQEKRIPVGGGQRERSSRDRPPNVHRKIPAMVVVPEKARLSRGGQCFRI